MPIIKSTIDELLFEVVPVRNIGGKDYPAVYARVVINRGYIGSGKNRQLVLKPSGTCELISIGFKKKINFTLYLRPSRGKSAHIQPWKTGEKSSVKSLMSMLRTESPSTFLVDHSSWIKLEKAVMKYCLDMLFGETIPDPNVAGW